MMKDTFFQSLFVAFLCVLPLGATPLSRNQNHWPFDQVVAFGDSFTDAGNGAFGISNGTWPADPAYYKPGARRFSNGPVWAQQLAKKYGLQLTDYSVGGATSSNKIVQGYTGFNSTIPVPSTVDQTYGYFQSKSRGKADLEKSLFTVFIGANDIFFASNATASGTLKAIDQAVEAIKAKGGKNFLLVSYPSLDLIPFAITYNDSAYSSLLASYSKNLSMELSSYAASKTDIKVAFADLYTLFNSVEKDPKKYGFGVVREQCLKGVYPDEKVKRSVCKDPDTHFFWDEYHPTRKGHALVAATASQAIKDKFGH